MPKWSEPKTIEAEGVTLEAKVLIGDDLTTITDIWVTDASGDHDRAEAEVARLRELIGKPSSSWDSYK